MHRTGFIGAGICLFASLAVCASARSAAPLLLRNPSLSQDKIAFLYADNIWVVAREGGDAQRLTAIGAVDAGPYYSPDHRQIAYSTNSGGLMDVFVMNADGGVPRRLTWEAAGSRVAGWTSDGKDVLFTSTHASYAEFPRLLRIRADGVGSAQLVPLPSFAEGSLSADGATLAYVPVERLQIAWKHYRGGQTTPVWLANI